jgi:hypothetical protein
VFSGPAGKPCAVTRRYIVILIEIRDTSAVSEDSKVILTDDEAIERTLFIGFLMNILVNIAEKTDKSITYVDISKSVVLLLGTSASRESNFYPLFFSR